MNFKETFIIIGIMTLSVAIGASIALGVASRFQTPQPAQTLGSSSDNVLAVFPTATKVFVNSADTLVVATSSGRQYLELGNISGATTTPQAVYCNYGDRPAVLYQGFALFGSTSKAYALDNLYRGAIHCIALSNGALLTVTDF
jgi:hypothetical protein